MTTREIAGITAQIITVIHYSSSGQHPIPGSVIAGRLVSIKDNIINYAQGLASVTDSESGTTQWYHTSHNISSSIQLWLEQHGYTWPLSKDQHAHFILAFI